METTEDFLSEYRRIKHRTQRIFDAVPEQLLHTRLKEGMFSPGDQVRHIALIENRVYLASMKGNAGSYTGCDEQFGATKAEINALLRQTQEATEEFLLRQEAAFPETFCRLPAGAAIRVGKWLRLMAEHEIHHRGQLYQLMTFYGIDVPQLYGMRSEDLITTKR